MSVNLDEKKMDDLTDNSKIIKFAQCKGCKHRDLRGTDLDYLGYQKAICNIFDGIDGLYKPFEFDLSEDDEDFRKCELFEAE
jgi:hypothetical protein